MTRFYPVGLRSKLRAKRIRTFAKLKLRLGIEKRESIDRWQDIPVIINNRNRFTYLVGLIDWLEKVGSQNIYILDNDSTYPPLLDFYAHTTHTVIYLQENIGETALWHTDHYYKTFRHNYFIYTDPDVLPDESCPDDAIEFMWEKLKRFESRTEKVGFGLRIDDLPDHFKLKKQIIDWEHKFWGKKIDDDVFDAPIDTTFAVYRPYAPHSAHTGYRTAAPYLLRHLPWYIDYDRLPEEEIYYLEHAGISSSLGKAIQTNSDYLKP